MNDDNEDALHLAYAAADAFLLLLWAFYVPVNNVRRMTFDSQRFRNHVFMSSYAQSSAHTHARRRRHMRVCVSVLCATCVV